MTTRIEDYAIIGNTCTVALVGKNGSLDWLCVPRFDSAACFAALLGDEKNGRWLIAPKGKVIGTRRRYRDNTLILETEFETSDGVAAVIDFMPIRERPQQVDVVRIVEGRKGTVAMEMETTFRFDYGSVVPWVTARPGGLRAIAGPDALRLRSTVAMRGVDFATKADFAIEEGQKIPFTLTYYPSHEKEPGPKHPFQMLSDTESWWRKWTEPCTIAEQWREPVLRSLITLKALTYGPTGGIVAAATTSLPEQIGGQRNWDYRICWLRDSTFTLYAFRLRAIPRRQRRGANGCCVRSRVSRARCKSCTASRGAAAYRVRSAVAAGLREQRAGQDRQRSARTVSARCLRRSHGLILCGAKTKNRSGTGSDESRKYADGIPRDRMEGARRRNLGSSRTAPPVHPFEDNGMGSRGSRSQADREIRQRGSYR